MMKKVILFIFVILAIPYSSFPSVSFLWDAKPIGAGNISLYSFQYENGVVSADELRGESVYVFPSQGPAIGIRYGLNEKSDILICYISDTMTTNILPGAFAFNTPISVNYATQLSGGTSSITLKRNILSTQENPILDASLVLAYEYSSYVIEYETTFWVMPPVTRKETIGYSRSATSLGLIMSRQVGFASPYIFACAKSLYLGETDRTAAVNGSGGYLGYGVNFDILGLFTFFWEGGKEIQRWEEGKDKAYGVAIDNCENSNSVFIYYGISLML